MHHGMIPKTNYTKEEVETWGLVWDTMDDLWDKVSTIRDYFYLSTKPMYELNYFANIFLSPFAISF